MMGFLDRFRKKAADLAEEHGDKVDDAVDKGAEFVDEKTGGKYTDQVESGAEKVKEFVDDLADDDEQE
jgi:hypothetical protein